MSYEGKNLETIALHAGWRADETTGSVAVPIHQTTSYLFESTEKAANLFALAELGNIYTRIMNPTNAVLEERMAAIDGGAAGLAVASGQTASAYSIQNLARAGDNIVSSSHLYGGTYNQFKNNLSEMGIEVRFVDPTDPEKGVTGNTLFTINERFTGMASIQRHVENASQNDYFPQFAEILGSYGRVISLGGEIYHSIR